MTTFKEYEQYDGLGLADLIRRKEVTPLELIDAAIERIEAGNPTINAVVYKMYDHARELARGEPSGPFGGVPTLLKDLGYPYAGFPMSRGSRAYKNYVPAEDNEMVTRIRRAGFITLGKTNTPEFGLLGITEPEVFGPCRNPHDTNRTPGGSSGGAAAAVAAGFVPLGPGGDGGGSIRIPAANCGLFGLKPTRGRTPTGPEQGQAWMGAAVAHAITRTVRDSAAMLDATQGPEPGSPYEIPRPERPYLEEVGRDPGQLRIAFNTHSPLGRPVDPACVATVEATAKQLEGMGHIVEEGIPEVDGFRVAKSFVSMYFGEIAAEFNRIRDHIGHRPTTRDVELSTLALGAIGRGMSAGHMLEQLHFWGEAGRAMGRFFGKYDLYVTPTTASMPVEIGALAPKPAEKILMQLLSGLDLGKLLVRTGALDRLSINNLQHTPFTQLANICGLPAMSLPLGRFENGLPLGVQFVTPFGREDRLFNLAGQLESSFIDYFGAQAA